jgi:hypothetical protein
VFATAYSQGTEHMKTNIKDLPVRKHDNTCDCSEQKEV